MAASALISIPEAEVPEMLISRREGKTFGLAGGRRGCALPAQSGIEAYRPACSVKASTPRARSSASVQAERDRKAFGGGDAAAGADGGGGGGVVVEAEDGRGARATVAVVILESNTLCDAAVVYTKRSGRNGGDGRAAAVEEGTAGGEKRSCTAVEAGHTHGDARELHRGARAGSSPGCRRSCCSLWYTLRRTQSSVGPEASKGPVSITTRTSDVRKSVIRKTGNHPSERPGNPDASPHATTISPRA